MHHDSSTNPYAIPDSAVVGLRQTESGVLLECAGCQKRTIRPFSAFLRHPQLAIPCPKCGTRHRLAFQRKSQFQYHACALPAIGLGLNAIYFALTGQTYRTMDRIMARVIRYFEWSLSGSSISFIEAGILIVLLLTPVLLTAFWGFGAQLRIIASEGVLQERTKRTPAG